MNRKAQNAIGLSRKILYLIALLVIALEQSGRALAQSHFAQVTVSSGKETKLLHAINIARDCRKMATPTVEISSPPVNGTVAVRLGRFTSRGPRFFIQVTCPERVLPGVGIYYKSRPGFRGGDKVSLRLLFEIDGRGNKTWDETVSITVQ